MIKPRVHRDKAITSKIMSAVKGRDSKAEKALARAMWGIGLRYRKHPKGMIGKPDYVFLGPKIAVFCDGDFWHGKGWEKRGFRSWEEQFEGLHNSAFWREKISRNMDRDRKVTERLQSEGWIVLRFSESEVLDNADKQAQTVLRAMKDVQCNSFLLLLPS